MAFFTDYDNQSIGNRFCFVYFLSALIVIHFELTLETALINHKMLKRNSALNHSIYFSDQEIVEVKIGYCSFH